MLNTLTHVLYVQQQYCTSFSNFVSFGVKIEKKYAFLTNITSIINHLKFFRLTLNFFYKYWKEKPITSSSKYLNIKGTLHAMPDLQRYP